MNDNLTIGEISEIVKKFAEIRDWDQFNTAKDIAIGISTEAAEVLELFRFKTDKDIQEIFNDPKKKERVGEELSDVLYFIVMMAQKYDINLGKEFMKKMDKNGEKYPVEKVKGINKKYNEYFDD